MYGWVTVKSQKIYSVALNPGKNDARMGYN